MKKGIEGMELRRRKIVNEKKILAWYRGNCKNLVELDKTDL